MNLPDKSLATITTLPGSNINRKQNKGTGLDRLLMRYISAAQRERENGNVEVASLLAMSTVFEQTELTLETVDGINTTIRDTIGLSLPYNNNVFKCDWKGKRDKNMVVLDRTMNLTKYRIDTISDEEIK